MTSRGGPLLALLLLSAAWSGCLGRGGADEPTEPSQTPPGFALEPRSVLRDRPVILVPGYSNNFESPRNTASAWNRLISSFEAWGWSQGLYRTAYYACDEDHEWDLSDYGSHEAHQGGPAAHAHDDCHDDGHDQYTPIEHLGYHLAWGIREAFNEWGRCVDVVGHSMGGLIVRYALAQVDAGNPEFPPDLCVEDVVTLGTPHGGALAAGLCGVFLNVTQCHEMTPGSEFLAWLHEQAPNPQVGLGTDWTVVGSHADRLVTSESATEMPVPDRVAYIEDNGVGHSGRDGFLSRDSGDLTAWVRFAHANESWFYAYKAAWPVRWADLSLVGQAHVPVDDVHPVEGPSVESSQPPAGPQAATVAEGLRVEVECSDDPTGQRVFVEFWLDGRRVETDEDKVGSSPTFTFRFPGEGLYEAVGRCRDIHHGSAEPQAVTWSVTVVASTP